MFNYIQLKLVDNRMNKICAACAADPESHSFKKISEKKNTTIFYTKPGAAKMYKDTEGILAHMENMLIANANKKWMCIIDGDDFDIRHATEFSTGHGIVELMKKYNATLVEIKIINPTWHMNRVFGDSSTYFTEEMRQKITVLDDRRYSVVQFI